MLVVVVREYCSSVIIDESHLSSALYILSTTKLKISNNKNNPPHNNRQKRLLLKASSYLSIGTMNLVLCGTEFSLCYYQKDIQLADLGKLAENTVDTFPDELALS